MESNYSSQTITIFGYGSLLDVESALSTMPSLTNHRLATLKHYRRSFNLVSIGSIRKGIANGEGETAALCIRPENGAPIIYGCLF